MTEGESFLWYRPEPRVQLGLAYLWEQKAFRVLGNYVLLEETTTAPNLKVGFGIQSITTGNPGYYATTEKNLRFKEGRLNVYAGIGFQIVAISPDTPEELRKTLDKDRLTFHLYSDSNAQALRNFGVAFRIDDQTFSMYKDRFGIDLERSSGQEHHILPVASVFLIDSAGKIAFVYANPDYKVRLKGEELLSQAKRIAGGKRL